MCVVRIVLRGKSLQKLHSSDVFVCTFGILQIVFLRRFRFAQTWFTTLVGRNLKASRWCCTTRCTKLHHKSTQCLRVHYSLLNHRIKRKPSPLTFLSLCLDRSAQRNILKTRWVYLIMTKRLFHGHCHWDKLPDKGSLIYGALSAKIKKRFWNKIIHENVITPGTRCTCKKKTASFRVLQIFQSTFPSQRETTKYPHSSETRIETEKSR